MTATSQGMKIDDDITLAELKGCSLSELNTILLQLFRERTKELSPSVILEQFRSSRFTRPSDIDPIAIRETELAWLKQAKEHEFQPLVLSPLTPLGTCSALGHVDQNNVVSAIRGAEVVSDATNVLALQLADDFKNSSTKGLTKRYSAVHRHVRGQAFANPKFSAHFSAFCLVSGGYDTGNFAFEMNELNRHISLIYDVLKDYFAQEDLEFRFYMKKNSEILRSKLAGSDGYIWNDKAVEYVEDTDHEYYTLLQFKVFVKTGEVKIDIADGGFVDWTQKLLSNKKHRCMISGIGIELLHRIRL
jgi:hypothetical protein